MKYILFAFAFLALVPSLTFAAEPLNVRYSIYAGGFEVLKADGLFEKTAEDYTVRMDMVTVGLLGKVAPWTGVMQSLGQDKGAQSIPSSHSFANTWRGETKTTKMTFNNDGLLTAFEKIDDDGTVENEMPDEDVYQGAVDILTGVYRAMYGTTCAGTQTATDGKRKFDMVFKSTGKEVMESGRYNKFNGTAEICTVEIMPVAGKWREEKRGWMSIQEQAKKDGTLPQIWFGKVHKDYPPIPVRLELTTDYGGMVMHLVSAK